VTVAAGADGPVQTSAAATTDPCAYRE